MKVVWSRAAEQDFYAQIDYLLEHRSEKIAEAFTSQVFETIERLVVYPELYAPTEYSHVRKAILGKHISLFYRLNTEREQITLLRFWPNRQDPGALSF